MNRFQTIEVTHLVVQSRLDQLQTRNLDCPYLPLSEFTLSESTAEDGISNQRTADR